MPLSTAEKICGALELVTLQSLRSQEGHVATSPLVELDQVIPSQGSMVPAEAVPAPDRNGSDINYPVTI